MNASPARVNAIWKFRLEIAREQVLRVFQFAKPLHVGLDPEGTPCLWCQVDINAPNSDMPVSVIGTGQVVPYDGIYRGSVNQGPFVWHVFTVL